LAPNVVACSAAMSACGKGQRWVEALSLLCEMRSSAVPPNGFSYAAAIGACGKSGQWAQALALWEEARCSGVKLSSVVCSTVIGACAVGGQWEQAFQVLDEMQRGGLPADVITYTAALSACERGRQWEQAAALLAGMRRMRVRPDKICSSIVQRARKAARSGGRRSKGAHLRQGLARLGCSLGGHAASPDSEVSGPDRHPPALAAVGESTSALAAEESELRQG